MANKSDLFEDTIPIARLLLDPENPRLPEIQGSQRETIAAVAQVQGPQLVGMAKHITEYGLNPAELPIVMPTGDDPRNYYVLDGNRRINALKVLETPELAQSALKAPDFKKLKRLSQSYVKSPIDEVRCIVSPTREAADPWIQLRHRGYGEGAGPVAWTGQVAARYDERRGKRSPALQVLDFLQKHVQLEPQTADRFAQGRYPVTTLDRLLNTIYVREKLGLEKTSGMLASKYPANQLVPALKRVVEELGSGDTTVSKLKSQTQRIDYINRIDDSLLPNESEKLGESRILADVGDAKPKRAAAGKKSGKDQRRQRTTIIPKDCVLEIDHHRINSIYLELKELSSDNFPNSAAAMTRVFLELSLDHYLENKDGWSETQINGTNLQKKILATIKVFEKDKILTSGQLAPVRTCANKQSILGPTYKTLHEFIHNYHHAPIPTELRTLWDNLQLFFQKLWQ